MHVALLAAAAVAGCGTTSNKGVEKQANEADLYSLRTMGAKANAMVVFASSRAGTTHLFSMKSDGSDTKQLTKGPLTDWNPRFSPDGTKVLFSRSVEKGAREADVGADTAWDLFTIKADGEEPTKVVSDATWGSWISNEEILFVRGSKIMRLKLGGEESEPKKVMDLSRHAVFEGAIVRDPELARDGHEIAMTLAGSRRQVGIWSLKKKSWTPIASGAQITWFPDGKAVAWVSPTGKGVSEIMRAPLDEEGDPPEKLDPATAKLVDLQGKRTREAFPRLSADGKWLVFGAAIGSADVDLEDYELYIWEVGSGESPARLTFHSASDRWPDVFVAGGAPKEEAPKTEEAAAKTDEDGAEKAEKAPAAEPADKSEPEKKDEPAADAAEPPSEEASQPAAKTKPKAGKKKRR